MRAGVKRTDPAGEFETPEGCSILESSNDEDDGNVSIARARVPPGVTTEWHWLRDTEERYLVASGRGRVEVEGLDPTEIVTGDVVRIPANTPQRVTNTGSEDLVFHCICTPRFRQDGYHPGRVVIEPGKGPAVQDESNGFVEKVVLAEMAGKHEAIHAYDKILWVVRTGYTTLVFAGWGLLLASVADGLAEKSNRAVVNAAWPPIVVLFCVSLALAAAGYVVDQDFVRRKFRVIAALDLLLGAMTASGVGSAPVSPEVLENLRVAGDSDSTSYRRPGYVCARTIGMVIYAAPIISVALGVGLVGWILR